MTTDAFFRVVAYAVFLHQLHVIEKAKKRLRRGLGYRCEASSRSLPDTIQVGRRSNDGTKFLHSRPEDIFPMGGFRLLVSVFVLFGLTAVVGGGGEAAAWTFLVAVAICFFGLCQAAIPNFPRKAEKCGTDPTSTTFRVLGFVAYVVQFLTFAVALAKLQELQG